MKALFAGNAKLDAFWSKGKWHKKIVNELKVW